MGWFRSLEPTYLAIEFEELDYTWPIHCSNVSFYNNFMNVYSFNLFL